MTRAPLAGEHGASAPPHEAYLTISGFAAALGVTKQTIERWLAAGKIRPSHRTLGGHARFTQEHVEKVRGMGRSSVPQPPARAEPPPPAAPSPAEIADASAWIAAKLARRADLASKQRG